MKRTMTALLLVLVMALAAIGGAFAATDLANLVEGTWEIMDIKGESSGQDLGSVMAMIKSMGGKIQMTFQGGTYTMVMDALGQHEETSGSYSFSGDQIVMDGTALTCIVLEDEMQLTDGTVTMVLGKVDGSSEPAPVSSEGLIGSWKLIEDVILEGSENTLAAQLKPYYDAGKVFIWTFDGNKVTLETEDGDESLGDLADYTVDGDQLTIAGEVTFTYNFLELDGVTYLVLVQEQDEIVLQFMGEQAENPTPPVDVDSGSIVGAWVLTDVSGDVEGVEQLKQVLALGMTLTMTFDANGKVTTVAEVLGQSNYQDAHYVVHGNVLTMNGGDATFVINGTTMTIEQDGITMVMERK